MRVGLAALAIAAAGFPSPASAQEQDFLFLGDTAFLQENGVWQFALTSDVELSAGRPGEPAGAEAEAELEFGITDEVQIAATLPYRFEGQGPDRLGAVGLELASRIAALGPDGFVVAAIGMETPELEDGGGAWRAGPGIRASKALSPNLFVHAAGGVRFDFGRQDGLPKRTSYEASAAAVWRPTDTLDLVFETAWSATRARGALEDEDEFTGLAGAVKRLGPGFWIGSAVAIGLHDDQPPARLLVKLQAEW